MKQCLTSRGKTHETSSGGPKLAPKLGFSQFSEVCIISFLDIAQDCSSGKCLTSSRGETSKKYYHPN